MGPAGSLMTRSVEWELEQLRKLTDGEPAQRALEVAVLHVDLELGPLVATGVPTDAETINEVAVLRA